MRLINSILVRSKSLINYFISPFDNFIGSKLDNIVHQPIFIIGSPRTGSTLLIQSIATSLDVGYLTNLHCLFYGFPSLVEYLFHQTSKKRNKTFSSIYGDTKGLSSPCECGDFWYRFFSNSTNERMKLKKTTSIGKFKNSIKCLMHAMKRPIVFKNLYASIRLKQLNIAFPKALYIVTCRDEFDNAKSILSVRHAVHGDYYKWWAIKPPNFNEIKDLKPAAQVVKQIREINNIIEKDLEELKINPKRIFRVNYSDLCEDPNKLMFKLNSFINSNSLSCEIINNLPKHFLSKNKVELDEDLELELKNYVKEY